METSRIHSNSMERHGYSMGMLSVIAIMLILSSVAPAQPIRWEQTNGPGGGGYRGENIHCIISDGALRIFTSVRSGIYRSIDRGRLWRSVYRTSESGFVRNLAADRDGRIFGIANDGSVVRSTDHGDSWTVVKRLSTSSTGLSPLDSPPSREDLLPRIMFDAEGNVYASGWRESHRSTDHGATWTSGPNWKTEPMDAPVKIAIDSSGTLLAIGGRCGTPYRSTDHGATWEVAAKGLETPACPRVQEMIVLSPGRILCAARSRVIYLSTDGGLTWSPRDTLAVDHNAAWFARGIDGALYVGEYNRIERSTDEGLTWEKRPVLEVPIAVVRLRLWTELETGMIVTGVPIPQNEDGFLELERGTYFLLTSGIVRSEDSGKTWVPSDLTLPCEQSSDLVVTPDGTILCRSSHGGIAKSTDRGETWRLPGADSLSRTTLFVDLCAHPGGNIYSRSVRDDIFRSVDGGRRFVQATTPRWEHGSYNRILLEPDGSLLAYSERSCASRSTDFGFTWQQFDLNNPISRAYQIAFDSLGVMYATLADSGTRYVSDTGAVRSSVNGLVLSFDKGATWTERNLRIKGKIVELYHLAVSPTGTIYSSNGISVWRSTNRGKRWSEIYSPADSNGKVSFIRAIALNSREDIFIAGSGGVARSQDKGSTWEALHDGIGRTTVGGLGFDRDDRLYAGTYAQGVYRTTGPTTGGGKQLTKPEGRDGRSPTTDR